jgi:hypothetical protein
VSNADILVESPATVTVADAGVFLSAKDFVKKASSFLAAMNAACGGKIRSLVAALSSGRLVFEEVSTDTLPSIEAVQPGILGYSGSTVRKRTRRINTVAS